jgi:prevent-host-death family protein
VTRSITVRVLRTHLDEVLRAVQAGETLTVTRNGAPIAELHPFGRSRLVPRAVIARARATAPRIDADSFRADLDAAVDPSLDD